MYTKDKYFVTFIIGYFKALHSFSDFQNYYLYPVLLAKESGFKTVIIVKEGANFLRSDPHFSQDIVVIEYKNIVQFVLLLTKFSFKKSIFYINNHNIRSYIALFLTGIFGCVNIFMGHIQPKRTTYIRQKIFNFIILFTTYVRLNNQSEEKFLINECGVPSKKIVVIPIAINNNAFHLEQVDYSKRKGLLYYGNTTTQKGFPTMFEAVSLVKREVPDIEFHIVGSRGDYYPEDHVDEYGLAGNVFFHGSFSHGTKLNNLLNQFKIFLISTKAEGQCLAVYESALAGNALCLPKIMSFEDNFKDKALFHDLNDSKQLAENILMFLRNEKMIYFYNKKCQRYILENFSQQKIRESFLNFLNQVKTS